MKKKYFALVVIALLALVSLAYADGITLIPGSNDGTGSLGEDGKSWGTIRGTTNIIMEGATSDAYEATLTIPDPASDITYTFPAASGTLMTTAGAASLSLADTKALVGQATGLAAAKSVSLTGDVTGTMASTGAIATQIAANSVSATEIADNTITATQMAVNSIGATELGVINTVTVTITSGNTGADVAVEAGSLLLRTEKVSGFNNNVTITKDLYPDASGGWIINTDAHVGTLIINGIFLRP